MYDYTEDMLIQQYFIFIKKKFRHQQGQIISDETEMSREHVQTGRQGKKEKTKEGEKKEEMKERKKERKKEGRKERRKE